MPNRDLDRTSKRDPRSLDDDDMVRGRGDDMDDMSDQNEEFEDEDVDEGDEEDEGSF